MPAFNLFIHGEVVNFATPSRPNICAMASTSAPCRVGWGTATFNRPWSI
jgi:hypothetical protein